MKSGDVISREAFHSYLFLVASLYDNSRRPDRLMNKPHSDLERQNGRISASKRAFVDFFQDEHARNAGQNTSNQKAKTPDYRQTSNVELLQVMME